MPPPAKAALHVQKEKRSIAGSVGLHIAPGVDGCVVHADLIVHMRAGGTPTDSGIADNLAPLDARARHGGEGRKMGVPSADAETMVYDDKASVAGAVFGDGHDAISRGVDGGTVIRGYVNARVECAFPAERIEPLSKTIGNMAEDRPDGPRIRGVRKACHRDKAQAAAVDGDGRGISFQEGVLLDGTVKSVLGSYRIVGQVEGGRMITKNAVGHGHFGGKRLQ